MALLSVIRRWYFREKMTIWEIERRTGLSRNTVRKYLCAGVVEPKFKVPRCPSKLDLYAEKLTGWAADRGEQVTQAAAHDTSDAPIWLCGCP
jgi:predicted transcriptional regulator